MIQPGELKHNIQFYSPDENGNYQLLSSAKAKFESPHSKVYRLAKAVNGEISFVIRTRLKKQVTLDSKVKIDGEFHRIFEIIPEKDNSRYMTVHTKAEVVLLYDKVMVLIGYTYEKDALGQNIPTPVPRIVKCREKDELSNQFYGKTEAGLKNEVVLIVKRDDYQNEKRLEYNSRKYNIFKTQLANENEIEIACVGRVVP